MINRVVLVGRLTRDPELRYTPNGAAVANFTLAINRNFTNQQGERDADFIQIIVWRKPAENVANYLKKGSLCGVDGRLQTRSYDRDGRRIYVTEVISESVQFLDSRNGSNLDSTQNRSDAGNLPSSSNSSGQDYDDPFADGSNPIDISDDDFPF